jgi:hypothetical protein
MSVLLGFAGEGFFGFAEEGSFVDSIETDDNAITPAFLWRLFGTPRPTRRTDSSCNQLTR